MKIRIELNPEYGQQLLLDPNFQSELVLIYSEGFISEIWIENNVINSDEQYFKVMTLQMIKNHFCRIFNLPFDIAEIAYENNGMAKELIRLNTTDNYRKIATIVAFQAN